MNMFKRGEPMKAGLGVHLQLEFFEKKWLNKAREFNKLYQKFK